MNIFTKLSIKEFNDISDSIYNQLVNNTVTFTKGVISATEINVERIKAMDIMRIVRFIKLNRTCTTAKSHSQIQNLVSVIVSAGSPDNIDTVSINANSNGVTDGQHRVIAYLMAVKYYGVPDNGLQFQWKNIAVADEGKHISSVNSNRNNWTLKQFCDSMYSDNEPNMVNLYQVAQAGICRGSHTTPKNDLSGPRGGISSDNGLRIAFSLGRTDYRNLDLKMVENYEPINFDILDKMRALHNYPIYIRLWKLVKTLGINAGYMHKVAPETTIEIMTFINTWKREMVDEGYDTMYIINKVEKRINTRNVNDTFRKMITSFLQTRAAESVKYSNIVTFLKTVAEPNSSVNIVESVTETKKTIKKSVASI